MVDLQEAGVPAARGPAPMPIALQDLPPFPRVYCCPQPLSEPDRLRVTDDGPQRGQIDRPVAPRGRTVALAATLTGLLQLLLGGLGFAQPQGLDTIVGDSPLDIGASVAGTVAAF